MLHVWNSYPLPHVGHCFDDKSGKYSIHRALGKIEHLIPLAYADDQLLPIDYHSMQYEFHQLGTLPTHYIYIYIHILSQLSFSNLN